VFIRSFFLSVEKRRDYTACHFLYYLNLLNLVFAKHWPLQMSDKDDADSFQKCKASFQ